MRHLSNSTVGLLMAGALLVQPAQAHKTEVSGDVAGIWHLEPNHSPKAGEPSQVWIALTQQGGRLIPLDQCDCRLAIYKSGGESTVPVLEPVLEPTSPENYQGIPGTEVTFPEVGEYRLVLTGSPQGEATFGPFELSYTTVVAAGRDLATATPAQTETPAQVDAPGTAPPPAATPEIEAEGALLQPASTAGRMAWLLGGVGIVLVAFALGALWLRGNRPIQR